MNFALHLLAIISIGGELNLSYAYHLYLGKSRLDAPVSPHQISLSILF